MFLSMRVRGWIAVWLVGMTAAVTVFHAPVNAAPSDTAAGVPMVQASKIRDFLRITFQWPERTRFRTSGSGNQLVLEFEKAANPDFGNMLRQLHPHVTKAELSGDRHSVILTFDKPYRTRTFISGNTAGVDLLDLDSAAGETPPAETAVVEPVKSTPERLKPEKKAEDAVAQALSAASTAKLIKPDEVQAPLPKLKPAVPDEAKLKRITPEPKEPPPPAVVADTGNLKRITPEPEKKLEAAAEAKPSDLKRITPEPETKTAEAPKPETPAAAPAKTEAATAPATEPAKPTETKPAEKIAAPLIAPAAPATTMSEPAAPIAEMKAPTGPAGTIKVHATPAKNGFVLHFPWDRRVASAVFVRSNYLWVVFTESPKSYDWKTYQTYVQNMLGTPTTIKDGNYSIVRFPIMGTVYPKVTKKEKEFDWMVQLSTTPQRLTEAVRTITSSAPPLKPHLMIEVLEMAEPLMTRDPELGDELVIVPFYKPGLGNAPARRFIEFTLLQTAQGLAVQKVADDTRVALLRNGVKVTTPMGMTLSSKLPQLEPDVNLADAETLFPYDRWKSGDPKKVNEQIADLQQQISKAQGDNANRLRLRLAQLYLAEGLATEALGILHNIKVDAPQFYQHYRLAALSGAANFMMYRIREAAQDFAAPELEDLEEIELWKSVSNDLLGITDLPFNYLHYDGTYISKYPPSFRQRLAIIAADLAINRQEYNDALKIFDSLNRDKQLGPIQKYVDYMIATISAETGQSKAAIEIWKKMSENYHDRFMRARAEFALTGLLLREGKIKRDEAIRRLDHLRIVWRGDNFELNLLSLLSNMYIDEKQYLPALRTWREIVNVFPNQPEATYTAQRMAETFAYLFNEGGADVMKPLDALTLYYEFRELTPIGEAGDRMIQNLADRLVQVDLLDRAAALLTHQVRYRLEKEERSRVGARLALIQLLNHQPKEALETLQITGYGNNPPDLRATRNHLAAQALNALGQFDQALGVLQGDSSPDAELLRMNIYWNKKDWPNVIARGEQALGSRQDITSKLSNREMDVLMRLALAYVFEHDTVQLQYLRDYFTPLLPDGPKKEMFLFVTRDNPTLDNHNFASLNQEVADVESFLQKYRNDLQENELSSVIQ